MTLQALADPASAARQSKMVIDFATSALRAGDAAEAQRLLRDHLLKAPRDADALTKLAAVAADLNRAEEATLLLRRAADSDPRPERFVALLKHLQNHVGGSAVLSEIERMPPALRDAPEVRIAQIIALDTIGEYDREIAAAEELVALAPNYVAGRVTLGEALRAVGRSEEAIAAVRESIRRQPTYGEAYWALANFKQFRFDDADIHAMRKALRKDLGAQDSVPLNFALGKALEDRKLYPQSFRHYAAGNAIHAAQVRRADMFITPFVDAGLAVATAEFFEQRAGTGCADASPIFVVGMHRSGSTLIEQILASHPMIEGTIEIHSMQNLWNRMWRSGAARGLDAFQELATYDAKTLAGLGEEYLGRARAFRTTDRPFYVDKLPSNWMHFALVRLALPNAKIIDARRHPMATGFSNFKQHYRLENPFAYSQESIGAFYRDYWRFMRHVDEVQPGAVHRVINERLIDDPEGEIRRMLDFIGVPFDPACLDFHNNKRAVRTPSAEQVRRPINRDGVDQWKNYEPWLGPLEAALGPALEHWDD